MQKNLKKTKNENNKNKDSKKNIVLLSLILCVLIVFVFILRKKEETLEQERQQRAAAAKKEVPLVIADLLIEPEEPRSNSVIRLIPVMKNKPRGKYSFTYRWFVNGEEIPNASSSLLPETYRIKNNKVYCRVKAVKGKRESKEKKSKTFVIGNSPPRVNHHPVENFSVPGEFTYRIDAFDPDGDPLEFNLLAPLGMGIEVDNRTGEIRWSIPPLPEEEKAPPVQYAGVEGDGNVTPDQEEEPDRTRIKIIVEVKDSEGAVTRVGIYLDLKNGREIAR